MVTGRAGLQSLMRPATYQLRVREDSRPQQPTEFIPREFMSALRAAAQAAPQATVAPQATAPQAEPQATVAPQAEPQATAQQDAGGTPSATSARYDPSNPYVAEAMRLEEKYNLPKGVFLALVQQESNFKPDAVSKAGAYGLAQLMPGTAEGLGVDPRDWKQNLDGGARYLAQQYKAFGGDLSLALAGYNAGPGAVIKAGNAIPNFPETQKYVAAVMRNAGYPMSPPKLADGGLIDLARKYADGGSVVGSAQVYDPAVIAAIAASIVEPQGYADGGTATGVSSDDATPPDYSGQYNTVLSEKLETEFQSLIKQIGRQRDLADYDMRGAFAAGQLKPDGRGHLTSQFKKPNHPTFSQDSIWNGSDGYTGGHWRQDAKQSWSFTPSATNLNMHGIGGLRDYWDKQEAPAGNVLNMGRIPFAAGGYVQGYAEGGVTTGVSSDETAPVPEQVQAPRTFADLVGRYGVGDAMQVAAPLDDQSLGAGVLRKISNYVRPIGQGFLEILPTVKNYAAGVAADPNPFTRLGSDISTLGSAVWEGVKNDPLGTVLDILPVVGEVRSAMDADEFRNKAVEAERAGDEKQAAMFRQLSAVGMAGAVPLVGMAARAANRGVKLGVEGAEVAARAGASGVEQAVETAAREGAAKSVEAAKFAGKAGSTPNEMAALLDDVRGTQIGKMADRYNSLPGEEATQLLYQDLKGLAVEGNVGKEWYERSSDRILEFVGGNKDQADKFAQLIAIYSPQTSVDVNTQNAMKSYNRAIVGEQIWNGTIINPEITFKTIAAANRYMKELGGLKAGVTKVPLDDSGKRFLIAKHDQIGSYDNISTLDRDLKAHLVMNENIPFEGRKINNFYNNLMVQIDPSRLQGSTQDLWMARAFGFLDDAVGSGAKYDFMERMTADLAKEMNWKPHQIQAAIWVAMKTRQESVKDSVRAAALEQGIAKNVSDPKSPNNMVFQVIDGNEAQYANILREASLGANITEEAIALAARNFSDFLDQNLAYVSWETVPSTKIGHLDGLGDLPPQARAEYHTEMSKALQDSQGRDLLARYLNILTPGSVTSPGYWENASNPATLTQVGATRVKGAGQQPTIDSASRSAMELYSNALGLLLKQDGVGFHRPYYNPQVTKANGMEYQFEKALSRDDIINIGKLLDEKFDGSVALIPVGDKQVRILSFGDAKDQRGFHKAVDQVLQSASMDNAAGFRVFGSDGDLVFNNWKEKPNGEDYVSRISSAGRPDVLEYLSDFLAPKVQAVDRKFASQYNLKTNEKLENYLSGLGKNFERKAQGGVVRFAEGGHVQGYADGGSASGSASNSLADLYEKYYGEPTTRQRLPTYEEMGDNPVGYSSIYPPQYMSNRDPNVSEVSNVTLPGASRPLTYAELEAARSGSINLFDSLSNITSGGRSPLRQMAASVRGRDGLPPAPPRPGAGAANPIGIRAFHGSPHTFDRFDMAKLGTGEGAQSYGHGLYFAGDEAVARSYRQKLALGANKFLIDGDPQIKALLDASAQALNGTGLEKKLYRLPAMADTLRGKSWEEAALLFEESARKAKKGTMWKSTLQGDADLARGLDKNGVVNPFSGSMYEVNLRTHPDRLLDWDKPLSGQSAGVRGALAGVTDLGSIKFGGDAYQALANQMADKKGRGNFAGASAALKEFNIDGIRYLDGGSRAAGQGSSNYVMFDDKLIELLRRYGLLGMVGGGAAAAGGKQAPSEEQTDYAQGGSVDSVPVYDPAVIAAIAASITEDNYA